jgi:predicted acetyltransferase
MLRLVSVKGALGLLGRRSEALRAPLVLEVEDDVIAENAGEYTVGDSGVVRGVKAQDRVKLDVRQLAQLYAGYLSAEQLVRRGLVRSNSTKALELLKTLFPPGDPYVSPPDDF